MKRQAKKQIRNKKTKSKRRKAVKTKKPCAVGGKAELARVQKERRQAERALRRIQDQLVDAIESLDAGLVMLDEQERLVICNKKYKEMYSRTPGSFNPQIGQKYEDVLRQGCQNKVHEAAGLTPKQWINKRLTAHRHPGKTMEQQLDDKWYRISDLPTSAGGVVSLHNDITFLKNSQDELRRAKEAAERANRAKSDFLANMSHELRTPLNAILGYTQILRKDVSTTPQQLRALKIIEHSGQHLLSLITGVLDFTKIEAGLMDLYLVDFSLPTLLSTVRDIIAVRARDRGINFTYEESAPLPSAVRGDETKIRQILINILGNAVKFTQQGGVLLRVGAHKGKIRFEIHDTGPGIPPEKLKEIFLPFQQIPTGRHHVEGTGLGLSISRRMANMMGAEIQVESIPGEGARFWFDLLLPESAAPSSETTDLAQVIGYIGEKKRILIVDEVPENLSVLRDTLAPLGFIVQEAVSGRQCLELASKFQPHLILMDLRMPEIDGFETTRLLRNSVVGKNGVIIAISAGVSAVNRKKSIDAGCDDFIPKPFREKDLLNKVGHHLRLAWVRQRVVETEELEPESSTVLPPPKGEAAYLLDLAMKGDILNLRQRLDQLERDHPHYKPFIAQLRKLLQTFQLEKIRKLLKEQL